MAYGVSFRVAPGVHVYRSTSGAFVAFAIGLAFIGAYFRLFFLAIQIAVLIALIVAFVVGLFVFLIAGYFMTKRRLSELQACAVSPTAVTLAGRYTNPPTWGVYRVEGFAAGRRTSQYRTGNHPVRQHELTREFGAVELVMLFATSVDAKELKHLLETGRVSPVSAQ